MSFSLILSQLEMVGNDEKQGNRRYSLRIGESSQ
jgi:hypothetical protein